MLFIVEYRLIKIGMCAVVVLFLLGCCNFRKTHANRDETCSVILCWKCYNPKSRWSPSVTRALLPSRVSRENNKTKHIFFKAGSRILSVAGPSLTADSLETRHGHRVLVTQGDPLDRGLYPG